MFSLKKISLAALTAAAFAAPAFAAQRTIIIPASSDTGPQSAGVGITVPAQAPDVTRNPGAVGSYATSPDAPVSMIAYGRGGYYWTTTNSIFQNTATAGTIGNTAVVNGITGWSYQVPVGACVYGMGNNNPAWNTYDIQCPAGSGWMTVSYKLVFVPSSQTGA